MVPAVADTFFLVFELDFWMPGNGHIAEKYHRIPEIYVQTLSTKATIKSDEEK